MIFKLIFNHKMEYAQGESLLKLLQRYCAEFDDFDDIEEAIEISDEEAKTIMVKNCDYDETDSENDLDDTPLISLYDAAEIIDFVIIASSEWD